MSRKSLIEGFKDLWPSSDVNTKKVKASSKPYNSCYAIWDGSIGDRYTDPDTKEVLCFKTYDDALTALKLFGFNFWNPELSYEFDKPERPAHVCYTKAPNKSSTETS